MSYYGLPIEYLLSSLVQATRATTSHSEMLQIEEPENPCKYAKFTNGGGDSCTYFWICKKHNKYTDPQQCGQCEGWEEERA